VQELEQALEEETPVDAALVLDMSGSVRGAKLDALREAARAFLDGLHEGEQAALVAFREEVLLLEPFTADRARVTRALERAEPRGSTALCDAVYAALRLRDPGPRRSAVVVFSDGIDNLSWLAPSDVVEAASRSEAIVYGVTMRAKGDSKEPFLGDVVRATGGQLFEAPSERDLRRRFLDVLADIRARYVLSFAPSGAGSPGWHALDVRLKRVKGDVLARPGYWRGTAAP
jgi:VWFA-related protein